MFQNLALWVLKWLQNAVDLLGVVAITPLLWLKRAPEYLVLAADLRLRRNWGVDTFLLWKRRSLREFWLALASSCFKRTAYALLSSTIGALKISLRYWALAKLSLRWDSVAISNTNLLLGVALAQRLQLRDDTMSSCPAHSTLRHMHCERSCNTLPLFFWHSWLLHSSNRY